MGDDGLILMVCDLRDKAAVNAALKGADAAIWCVALDENRPSPVEILKGLLKIGTPKASVDVISEQLIELGTGFRSLPQLLWVCWSIVS